MTDINDLAQADLPARKAHPVKTALLKASLGLLRLQPTTIVGPPDMTDARALQEDLEALCAVIDPVVEAIGDYAARHFGFSHVDRSLFRDQLRGALEGNATYEIE